MYFFALEVFAGLDRHDRQFRAVDEARLQRDVRFGEAHRGRRRTERFERVDLERDLRHAHFEAAQVVGRLIGCVLLVDLLHSRTELGVERDEPRLRDRSAHVGAERAVERGEDLVVVSERERQGDDRDERDHVGERPVGDLQQLDRARADLREHLGVVPELIVGKDVDV